MREEGLTSSVGGIRPSTPTPSAGLRAPPSLHPADLHPARPGHGSGRAGAQALRNPQTRGSRSGAVGCRDKSFFDIPSLSSRTIVYKGLLLATQIASSIRSSPTPTWSAPLPGAPALLDQYVPDLEAGPPVPLHLPQRRDQYPARQQALDGRAPVHTDLAAVRGRHEEAFPHRQCPAGAIPPILDNVVELLPMSGRSLPHVHGDAHSGGLGRRSHHACGKERFLRISRLPDGALGRPGRDRLHRRPRHRRDSRPQRPAPGALPRHERRPCRHGLRSRRPSRQPEESPLQRPPAARPHVPGRPRSRPASSPTRRSKQQLAARQPYARVAEGEPGRARTICPARRVCIPTDFETILQRQRAFGYTDEDLQDHPRSRWRRRARSRSAPWAPTRRWPASPTSRSCCSITSSSSSPRSPIRPSTRSAKNWSCRSPATSGAKRNILDETPQHCHTLKLTHPILTN